MFTSYKEYNKYKIDCQYTLLKGVQSTQNKHFCFVYKVNRQTLLKGV